ncbi:MAG: Gx transporter family protein, partial [Oscillospiraceae bacterium]|nr:Gx transporter family protein [Oscillospiraceae bacterium]
MRTKRLTELALLTSLALIIFVIELRIPDLVPIPGVKLGLANIITVYAVF